MRTFFAKHFILARALTSSIAITDLISLIEVIQAPIPQQRFFVTFFTARLVFYLLAYLFSIVRKMKWFYNALFSDMNDPVYWQIIFFVFVAFKAIFISSFIQASPLLTLISFNFVVMVLGSVLIVLQSMVGTLEMHRARERRIYQLIREARLSKAEFEAMQVTLIERGKRQVTRRKPVLAWLMNLMITIIVGACLAAYASNISDFIQKHWFSFPNLFPPY